MHADAPVPRVPLAHARAARLRTRAAAAARRRSRRRRTRAARSCCSPPATATATSRTSRGPGRGVRAQRHRGDAGRAGDAAAACRKLELGDLEAVAKLQGRQHPGAQARWSTQGYDIVAPIPSCVLMFKQELPLMFPDDADVQRGASAHLRSVRIPDAAPQGRPAAHRLQGSARQGQLPRALPPARAEHRPEDARRAASWCPDTTVEPSSAAPATTAPTR